MPPSKHVPVTRSTEFVGSPVLENHVENGFVVSVATGRPSENGLPLNPYNVDGNTKWLARPGHVDCTIHLARLAHLRAQVQHQDVELHGKPDIAKRRLAT
jgi:hypothetical protein